MPNTVAAKVKNWEISSSVPPAGTCSALSHIPAAPNAAADIREKTAQQYCTFSLGFTSILFYGLASKVLGNCCGSGYQWLAVKIRIAVFLHSNAEVNFSYGTFVYNKSIGVFPRNKTFLVVNKEH